MGRFGTGLPGRSICGSTFHRGFGMQNLDFPDLLVTVVEKAIAGRNVTITAFQGRITNGNAAIVNQKIHSIFLGKDADIILDLSALEYINSSGVAMLFALFYKARENELHFAIGGLHPFLRTIFGLLNLPPEMQVYDTLEDAQNAFS